MANRSRSGRLDPDTRAAQARQLRGEGLTQREIAERLGVSLSTIANDLHRSKGAGQRSRRGETTRSSEPQATRWPRLLSPLRVVVGAVRRLSRS